MSGETDRNVSGWTVDTLHSHLLQLLDERLATVETRFDGMDKANDVLAATVNRVPTDVDRQVSQLKAVHDERFHSLEDSIGDLAASMVVRFQERDTRSEREARDNKIAVDAAFAAAKEAVAENNKSSALANDKSEASFTKQIDALANAVDSKFQATGGQVDDLKAAVAALTTQVSTLGQTVASQRTQANEARTQQNWSTGVITASVLAGLSLLVAIVVAVALIIHG